MTRPPVSRAGPGGSTVPGSEEPRRIRSWTAGAILLLVLSLLAVLWVVVTLMRRDHARLIEQFAVERHGQLRESSRSVTEALDDVGDDLRLAAELLGQGSARDAQERELRALLEAVGQLKALCVVEADGTQSFTLIDRRAGEAVSTALFQQALLETARAATRTSSGAIITSPPLGAPPGGWYRVFATSLPLRPDGEPSGAVAVLADTEPFFAPLRAATSPQSSRLVLLGVLGLTTPATDPLLSEWVARVASSPNHAPQFANVLERMRAGDEGHLRIGEEEAEKLGLGPAEAIVAFVPLRPKAGKHWSVAALDSTTALRTHERAITLRFALAAALVAIVLSAFAAWVMVASRRTVALRERLRHADRLAHLHDKTQKILDNIPTGVLALSASGQVTAVNRALGERLPPGVVGLALERAFLKASAPAIARLHALVASACACQRVSSLFGEPLALFGTEGHYSIHAVPLEPREPEVRVLLVVEDLSDVKALETQLLRAEKLATVGVLGAGIAHEIGTPLGVVRGRAEYMLDKVGPGHLLASGLGVIISQIDRVSRTIRELLDFSRIQQPLLRPTALAPLARSLTELLRSEVERRRLLLETDIPESLPLLAADPDQLQQVLVNLALNACDACQAGGRVRLSARPVGSESPSPDTGMVRFEVSDDGCGIPSEHKNLVFDPFFTTKKRGHGTGLGLTVVAQVVQSHGGRIEVESDSDRGTRVSVFWPIASNGGEERHAG